LKVQRTTKYSAGNLSNAGRYSVFKAVAQVSQYKRKQVFVHIACIFSYGSSSSS